MWSFLQLLGTVFFCNQTNLVLGVDLHEPACLVKRLDGCAQVQACSEDSVCRSALTLKRSEPLNCWSPNLVWRCIVTGWSVVKKCWLASCCHGNNSEHVYTVCVLSPAEEAPRCGTADEAATGVPDLWPCGGGLHQRRGDRPHHCLQHLPRVVWVSPWCLWGKLFFPLLLVCGECFTPFFFPDMTCVDVEALKNQ